MPDLDDLDDAISQAMTEPAKASADGVSAESHPLSELSKLRRDLAADEGAANPRRGIRFTKLVPPGAV